MLTLSGRTSLFTEKNFAIAFVHEQRPAIFPQTCKKKIEINKEKQFFKIKVIVLAQLDMVNFRYYKTEHLVLNVILKLGFHYEVF